MSESRETWTKSRVQRLGKRLARSAVPEPEALTELHELLAMYDDAMATVERILRDDLGIRASTRLKTTKSTLEKLLRQGGGSLPNIQDLAGARIVEDMTWLEQNALADRIAARFQSTGARAPRIHDRRLQPTHGYRAVHVVVYLGTTPVEIQIRTMLQHEWANLFEKLADVVGRGIRYGEDPDDWAFGIGRGVWDGLKDDDSVSEGQRRLIDRWVNRFPALIRNMIDAANDLSNMIVICELGPNLSSGSTEFGLTEEQVAEIDEAVRQRRPMVDQGFQTYRDAIDIFLRERDTQSMLHILSRSTMDRECPTLWPAWQN